MANKPDSHDICFIPDGDTAGWLAEKIDMTTGDIVDESGEKVGEHPGANAFTVGQRRGLKLGTPAADGKPRFVLDISPVDRTVTVGSREELAVAQLTASKPRWCGPVPDSELHVKAQLRAHGEEVAVTARLDGDLVVVDFDEPTSAVAPGQAVVLYDGTRVIGSATIDTVSRAAAQHA